jgi:peptidoglycan hydrolase CwlO-like protein
LVRRAIERAEAEIDRLQDQVAAMMDKQRRRMAELEKLQAKGGV